MTNTRMGLFWAAASMLALACGDSESSAGNSQDSEDTSESTTFGSSTSTTTSATTSIGTDTTDTTSTTDTGGECPPGTPELCDDSCIDTTSNPLHCGGCFFECGAGEVCANSACASSCPDGTSECDGACVDTQTNPLFCGDCFTECEAGEVCSSGECSVSCGGGTTDCGGACVDTASNPMFCGDCDTSCGSGAGWACQASACIDIRTWSVPELIETDDADDATGVDLAMDATGNAVAVWVQDDGTRRNIWANLFDGTNGTWGTATAIETDNTGNALEPRVSVDDTGYAFAVWRQTDGALFNAWSNRYDVSMGAWETPTLIESQDNGNAELPAIAVDPAGNAIAVWQQINGTRNIWSNRYTVADNMWGAGSIRETEDLGNADTAAVAVDPAGNAVAVWRQTDGTPYDMYASNYDVATDTWSTRVLLESNEAGNANEPAVAMDANGNAIAVWRQTDSIHNLWANRFDAGSGTWGMGGIIETGDEGNVFEPDLAFDSAGNAFVIWRQLSGGLYNIYVNRYDSMMGTWSGEQVIESFNTGNGLNPSIAFDGDDNAIAVWHQDTGQVTSITANRYYSASGTWGTPELIESSDLGDAVDAKVVVDSAGRALAVWSQSNDVVFSIWAARLE